MAARRSRSAIGSRSPRSASAALPPAAFPDPDSRAGKFLQAAVEVFLEKGYGNARLSDIVARSGGSLSTLYQLYGGKKGLARAIMEQGIGGFARSLEILDDPRLTPAQALPVAAVGMLEEILTPRHIVIHRIIIAEGVGLPDLRDWFFEHGVAPPIRILAGYFSRQKRAGNLLMGSPTDTANRFYMMVFGDAIIRSTAGTLDGASLAQTLGDTRQAVALLVRGMLPPGQNAA